MPICVLGEKEGDAAAALPKRRQSYVRSDLLAFYGDVRDVNKPRSVACGAACPEARFNRNSEAVATAIARLRVQTAVGRRIARRIAGEGSVSDTTLLRLLPPPLPLVRESHCQGARAAGRQTMTGDEVPTGGCVAVV